MVQGVYKVYCQDLDAIICEKNIPYLNDMGEFVVDTHSHVYYLFKNRRVTKDYYRLEYIGNDNFIVCEAIYNCKSHLELAEYWDEVEFNLCFREGVIRLTRDEKGEIIPFAEQLVVPILYEQVTPSNFKTVKVLFKDKYCYYDIDSQSNNYCQRLCPLILDEADDFDLYYPGYASCKIGSTHGYLSRASKEYRVESERDLLTTTDIEADFYDEDEQNRHLIKKAFERLEYQTDGEMYLRRTKK